MTVNFRYRIEVEGEEPYWMWQKDAAIGMADNKSYHRERMGIFNIHRVRVAKVIDENIGQVIAQFGPKPDNALSCQEWQDKHHEPCGGINGGCSYCPSA